MFGFGSDDDHKKVYGEQEHKSKWSHELVAGAVSWEATRLFEKHQEKNGKPVNHKFAKELVAGFVGAEVDKLFETKGLDHLDKDKVKKEAVQAAESKYQGQ